jgi:hypothetical protein
MNQNPFARATLFTALAAAVLSSCATVQVPKDYVPDSKVVYLMQRVDLDPIRYELKDADPYVFEADSSAVDAETPRFLGEATFEGLLKPDYAGDTRLYREAVAHFRYVLDMPLFAEMRKALDEAEMLPPEPLPANKGAKLQEYSNGAQYEYPDSPGAKITQLTGGVYFIEFPDGSKFQSQPDGVYFWNDAKGHTVQQNDPKDGVVVAVRDGVTYTSTPTTRKMEGPLGSIEYNEIGDPMYCLEPAAKSGVRYVYFVDERKAVKAVSLTNAAGIRFDYFPADGSLLAVKGSQAVTISADYRKYHSHFDSSTRKTTNPISYYYPQGIKITNLDSSGACWSEDSFAWPEGYSRRQIGPFDVWYTAKDAPLLDRLSASRLTEIAASVSSLSGLSGTGRRSLVIPPDLESYRKLQATRPGDRLFWYPSGFETLDYITLWPFSVPRYSRPEGERYFYDEEIYEIIAHEYTHLLVGENSGVFGEVPVWLNEGLAVYVEGRIFPDAGKYWETTFVASRDLKRLLPWDDVTVKTTGEYPLPEARVHYAQSYALVSRLIAKYGVARVASYVKSFRPRSFEDKVDLVPLYKANFAKAFGVAWDGGAELLKPSAEK